MTDWPVLRSIEEFAGRALDGAFGGALTRAAEQAHAAHVRRIFLADGLVEQADAPLSLMCSGMTWVEWRGGGEMLAAKSGAQAAAFLAPITSGQFIGGCSVSFWARTADALLPIPGRVIVTRRVGPLLSPVDQMRAAANTLTANDATDEELRRMDTAICRFGSGDLYLRCLPDGDTNQVDRNSADDGRRTWAGPELREALANVAVECDHTVGILSPERPAEVRESAFPFVSLLIERGPRAALRILSTLAIRRQAN